jgi:hypothetical protein
MSFTSEKDSEAIDVEEDHATTGSFHARREGVGDVAERIFCGAKTPGSDPANLERARDGTGLSHGEPLADPESHRFARHREERSAWIESVGDGKRLAGELGLRTTERCQRKIRNEETGDSSHDRE